MPVPNLDIASTVSDGLARQHLRDDARATTWYRSPGTSSACMPQVAPNPYLQLRQRIRGFARSMLDRELYEQRSLIRVRCMRGTLFALPLDLLPVAWAATRHLVLNTSASYLASQGLDTKSYEQWANRIRSFAQHSGAVGGAAALGVGCRPTGPASRGPQPDVRRGPAAARSAGRRLARRSPYLPPLRGGTA